MQLDQLLDKKTINQYLTHLKTQGVPAATLERKLASIRRFSVWALPGRKRSHLVSMTRCDLVSKPNRLSGLYQTYTNSRISSYLHLAILVLFAAAMAVFGYNQIFKEAPLGQAYPQAPSPKTPNRYLSFQARLTDSSDNPITTPTDFRFIIYNNETASASARLWEEIRYIDPDQDGIFSVTLGTETAIASSIFSENVNLWLGVTVKTDAEATPRQRIATVGYALNAETLQGFPPSASASADQIPVLTQEGDLVLAAANPMVYSSSGTFAITGQALSVTTDAGTNGSITIAPNGTGQLLATGGTTSTNFLRITDANLTSGHLISGYVGNGTATGDLLNLSSGASEAEKFTVDRTGNTDVAGYITATGTLTANGTLDANGQADIGDGGDAITLNGSSVTLTGFNTCTALETNGSGVLACGTDDTAAGGTIWWTQTLGALYPINATLDLLLGGTATTSAKFAVLNMNTGTPTASISANSGNNATFLTGDGTLSTALNASLKLNPNGGNIGIGTSNPATTLHLVNNNSGGGPNVRLATTDTTASKWSGFEFYSNTTYKGGLYRRLSNDNLEVWTAADGNNPRVTFKNDGTVGIGDTTPAALLTVGNGDLFQIDTSGRIVNLDNVAHTIDDVAGDLTLTSNSSTVSVNDALAVAGILDVNGADGSDFANSVTFNDNVTLTVAGSENLALTQTSASADAASITTTTTDAAGLDALSLNMTAIDGTDRTNSLINGSLTAQGTAATDIAYGLYLDLAAQAGGMETAIKIQNTAAWNTDIDLQNEETISNATDDTIVLTGVGGTNNTSLTIDLDGAGTTVPTLIGGASDLIAVNDGLSIGIDGATTENIAAAGFAISGGNDLYVEDMLGVNGAAYFDSTVDVAGTLTAVDLSCTDCLDFPDLEDTMDLDSGLTINQSTNTWTQNFTGTTTTGLTYNANSLTTGTALSLASTSADGGASGASYLLNLSRSGTNSNASHTAYGLYSNVTNTGTTSTNIGGYFSASGATNNYAALFANGSVGIGTTAPSTLLYGDYSVDGSGVSNVYSLERTDPNTPLNNFGVGLSFLLDRDDMAASATESARISAIMTDVPTAATALTFSTKAASGSLTEYMRLDAAGNVGIGTTAPAQKLHLDQSDSSAIYAAFTNSTTGATSGDGSRIGLTAQELLQIWNFENTDIQIGTNNTEAVRIDTSGNVGIGTTGPGARLDVLSTTEQQRLSYNASNYTSFTTSSGGDLTLNTTGNNATITDVLTVTSPGTSGSAIALFQSSGTTQTANYNALTVTMASLTPDGVNLTRGIYLTGPAEDTVVGPNDTAVYVNGAAWNTDIRLQNGETIDNDATDTVLISDGGGTGLISASTTLLSLNLTSTDQPERLCHGGADGSRAFVEVGDCAVSGADFAEYSLVAEPDAEPGDLVYTIGNDPLDSRKTLKQKSQSPYQNITGVISTNPFIDILGETQYKNDPRAFPIALRGKAPVKVSLENGPIRIGDPLVSSSHPGIAMKATKPGEIIGFAEENYDGTINISDQVVYQENSWAKSRNGRNPLNSNSSQWLADVGKIMVDVNPHYFDPDIYLTESGELKIARENNDYVVTAETRGIIDRIGAFAEAVAGKIRAGAVEADRIVGNLGTFSNLRVTAISPLQDNAVFIEGNVAIAGDASVAGTLTAGAIESSTIDLIRDRIAALADGLNQPVATPPATIDPNTLNALYQLLEPQPEATPSSLTGLTAIESQSGFFSEYLAVLGQATITDLRVTNSLTLTRLTSPTGTIDLAGNFQVNGNLTVSGNVNILGELTAPTASFSSLLAQKAEFDEAVIDRLTTSQLIIAAGTSEVASDSSEVASSSAGITTNATAGKGALPAGQTEYTIYSPHVSADDLIYVTPLGDSQNQVLYVKAKQENEWFKVAINQPLPFDLKFNWWIIRVEPN